MLIDPAISLAFSLSVAALLAAAAAHKIKAPGEFVSVLRNYQVMPDPAAPAIGSFVIAAEFACAAGMLLAPARMLAGLGAAALFAIYAAAIGVNLARGRTAIDCGCSFGGAASSEKISPYLIIRNAALAAAAAGVALPTSSRTLGALDYYSIAFFALSAGALYLAGEFLRSNAARFGAME